MGFNAPSKIQETALPTLLADPPQNMIAQSQSGTGKTASFVLAMLSRVDSSKRLEDNLNLSQIILSNHFQFFNLFHTKRIKLEFLTQGPRNVNVHTLEQF